MGETRRKKTVETMAKGILRGYLCSLMRSWTVDGIAIHNDGGGGRTRSDEGSNFERLLYDLRAREIQERLLVILNLHNLVWEVINDETWRSRK